MVKKLFKHEFLAHLRIMGVVYVILLTIAGAGRLIQCFEQDNIPYKIVSSASILTYGVSVMGAFAFTFVLAIVRFYKNLFTAEGYLSFTLPVTPAQHIFVKSVTALTMELITFFAVLLSGCIITAGEVLAEIWKAAAYLLDKLHAAIGFQDLWIGMECILLLVLWLLADFMLYYLFIAIGQLFKKHRILAAVGAYFAYYILTQILSTVGIVIFSVFATSSSFDIFMAWLWEFIGEHPYVFVHSWLWLAMLIPAALSLVSFFVIKKIITKKLNLE